MNPLLSQCSESTPDQSSDDGRELVRRGTSVRVIADASVALVDHTRAERPGLDQIQPTSSVTGGRNGVPPPTTWGLRNMRSSSTRPSSIAAAARPAPPTPTTSASVAAAGTAPGRKRNIEIAERLIAAGRMHPAGIAELESARADGRSEAAYAGSASIEVPDDLDAHWPPSRSARHVREPEPPEPLRDPLSDQSRQTSGNARTQNRAVRRNAGPRRDDPPTETRLINDQAPDLLPARAVLTPESPYAVVPARSAALWARFAAW